MESGQRKVYMAKNLIGDEKFVLKICPLQPILVARIKREITLLSEFNSSYFPKFYFQHFVTEEVLRYFTDNLNPKTQKDRIIEIEKMDIKPFLVTVEEFVEHNSWEEVHGWFHEEKNLIEFLVHIFSGLDLLWQKKVVHRDLKPENILIRPSKVPAIIDLGIAKNMVDGATQLTHPLFPSP